MSKVLILRPEPGDAESAARACRLGLEPVTAPIFAVRPLAWEPPAAESVETILLTSANAARHGGPALARYIHLPCHAVGETTALAARAAGFASVRAGPSDGVALLDLMAREGVRQTLHLCGREHIPLAHPAIHVDRRIVYASEPIAPLPLPALAALEAKATVLLHSPRAGAHFAALVDAAGLDRGDIALIAISEAAARAAGAGWKSKAAAAAPRDEALLELAAKLCKIVPAAAG